MLITAQGMVNRTHVSEIRVVGRNTQGVRIMNLNEGDKIASLAKVAPEENGTSSSTEASGGEPPPTEEPPRNSGTAPAESEDGNSKTDK
jgi:DNA gyrase/topoisomerase IV subunit A